MNQDYTGLIERFQSAKNQHDLWVGLWQECYDYALPQRGNIASGNMSGARRQDRLYDGTALDAVDQLASLLLGNLTPPMTSWFGLKAGTDITEDEAKTLRPALERSARILQNHFDQSNFIVEFHQALLDLVVGGTASLMFEEAEPGELSAFRFSAIPLGTAVLDEADGTGRLTTTYRAIKLNAGQIRDYYEGIDEDILDNIKEQKSLIEVTAPDEKGRGYQVTVFSPDNGEIIAQSQRASSPFINFRWMKSPDEIYGRSPVMKALPDIKTANKVVELILKNASISVTGIWQAEDDGVLNLSNIELVPGAIIPKAMGSKGLTPLEMPARFDVSQLVLEDLRSRIRHALLADRLPQITDSTRRTATEISERSNEMALLLGATFGRLQVELLNPLIKRAYEILRRRGEIADLPLDGRTVTIDHRSPLARAQSSRHVQTTLDWLQAASQLGPDITEQIDKQAILSYLTEMLGVPGFIRNIPQNSTTSTPTTGD